MQHDLAKLVLTMRDYQLFHFLFRGKVSTVSQINKHIFSGIEEKTVHRRLTKLRKANFLSKGTFLQNDKPRVTFSLGEDGLAKIKEQLPYRVTEKSHRSDSPEHDITLNDIWAVLKGSHRISSYFSENELQTSRDLASDPRLKPFVDLNSDGVLSVQKGDEKVFTALEYDANKKAVGRYKDKIKQYYAHSSVPAVFYIGRNRSVLNAVQNAERLVVKDLEKKFKFYYCSLNDVLECESQVTFESLSGRSFRF
jgi:DNA-binding MarR family transcriptional regulator